MNTDELRAALADQERFAPRNQAVVDDLAALLRPHRRRPHWGTGLLAAAAVAGIVAATTTLLHPSNPAPDRSTTSTTTAAATATSAPPPTAAVSTLRAPPTPTSPSVDSSQAALEAQAQRQAEQAEQAASSAEAAANTAATVAATATAQCNAAARSHPIDVTTAITSTTIRPLVEDCAKAWGPAPGYTVEWVQTTVGKLHTLSTGEPSQDTQQVVAIQIHAVFTKGGQSGPAETMLIHLRHGLPPGVDMPANPLNLAVLGKVHHW